MNKYLCAVIGAMWALLMAGGWLYISRCEAKFEIVDKLWYKDFYLNGEVKAAPVPLPTPPVAAKK